MGTKKAAKGKTRARVRDLPLKSKSGESVKGGSGKRSHKPILVTKELDQSSPTL